MKLITLEREMPVFNPEIRTIEAFSKILRRDRGSVGDSQGRAKATAIKELAFVYFYCSFDSRFDVYETDTIRNDKIREAVGLPEDWEVDDIIREAVNVYHDMMQTESMRLVNRARNAIRKYEEYLDDVSLTEVNMKTGNLLHDAKKYRENVNGVAEMISKLNEAKVIVEKELEDMYGKGKGKPRSMIEDGVFGKVDGKI